MKTILVLTDFSTRANKAAEFALGIAAAEKAAVVLHHSSHTQYPLPAEAGVYPFYEQFAQLEEENRKKLDQLARRLWRKARKSPENAVPSISIEAGSGNLPENIRRISAEKEIWMIVMGGKGHETAMEHLFFGSEAYQVIDSAACPVLLIPDRTSLNQVKKIGFATDLNWTDRCTIHYLTGLAKMWHASVDIIHIDRDKGNDTLLKHQHYLGSKKLLEATQYKDVVYTSIEAKNVPEAIEKYSTQKNLDLLAVIHRKRSAVATLFHSSVSKKILALHKTPVLIMVEA